MTDLREKVEDDRGLIKKIELAIPGFRGYRKREDLRIADRLLREQLADMLGSTAKKAESCRDKIVDEKELGLLDRMRKLVNEANTTEKRMRHAEQGYTGVSPDYRIEEEQLNRLYEWDLGLIDDIDRIQNAVNALDSVISTNVWEDVSQGIDSAIKSLEDFNALFEKRREAIAGLIVGGK